MIRRYTDDFAHLFTGDGKTADASSAKTRSQKRAAKSEEKKNIQSEKCQKLNHGVTIEQIQASATLMMRHSQDERRNNVTEEEIYGATVSEERSTREKVHILVPDLMDRAAREEDPLFQEYLAAKESVKIAKEVWVAAVDNEQQFIDNN